MPSVTDKRFNFYMENHASDSNKGMCLDFKVVATSKATSVNVTYQHFINYILVYYSESIEGAKLCAGI